MQATDISNDIVNESLTQFIKRVFITKYFLVGLTYMVIAIGFFAFGNLPLVDGIWWHFLPECAAILFFGVFISKINVYGYRISGKFIVALYSIAFLFSVLYLFGLFGVVYASNFVYIYLISVWFLIGYVLGRVKRK